MYADYNEVKEAAKLFSPYVEKIGQSRFGRNIYAFVKGSGGILVQAGIHAREHIGCKVLLEILKRTDVLSFPAISLVPLVNPDGTELALKGAEGFPNSRELKRINRSDNFSLWKANARGVDLNVNFAADWGKGKRNVFYPSPSDYVGEYPESERESEALASFARRGFKTTISLHAKGEIVFYAYRDVDPDPVLNEIVASSLGYPLARSAGSAGGFKDWCVLELGIPSYTVELGKDDSTYVGLYDDLDDLVNRTYALIKACKEYYYG